MDESTEYNTEHGMFIQKHESIKPETMEKCKRLLWEIEGLSDQEARALTDMMVNDHRTHQQHFGRLIYMILCKMVLVAKKQGSDARNEATVEFVQAIDRAGCLDNKVFPRI